MKLLVFVVICLALQQTLANRVLADTKYDNLSDCVFACQNENECTPYNECADGFYQFNLNQVLGLQNVQNYEGSQKNFESTNRNFANSVQYCNDLYLSAYANQSGLSTQNFDGESVENCFSNLGMYYQDLQTAAQTEKYQKINDKLKQTSKCVATCPKNSEDNSSLSNFIRTYTYGKDQQVGDAMCVNQCLANPKNACISDNQCLTQVQQAYRGTLPNLPKECSDLKGSNSLLSFAQLINTTEQKQVIAINACVTQLAALVTNDNAKAVFSCQAKCTDKQPVQREVVE